MPPPIGIIVSNASPLIILSTIGEFRLLKALFGEIRITPEVRTEIVERGGGRPGSGEVAGADFIQIEAVADARETASLESGHGIGRGEASTLALARQIGASIALIDDHRARMAAKSLGIPVAGTLRVLETAHEKGRLPDLAGAYRRLLGTSARILPDLLDRSLHRYGLPPL